MKKGQEYAGIVERVDFPNKGIVKTEEGETAVVKGTIKCQKVRFRVNKVRSGKAEGQLLEVMEQSPLETVTPPCPHFGKCGGCTYQTLPYEEQLRMKAEQVQRILEPVVKGDYEFEGIKGSPLQFGYRNKMEFSFGDEMKDGPLTLGLHKKGGFYDILTTSECKIVNEDYGKILETVLDICTRMNLTYCHKMTHKGYLRHLVIRRAATTGEILVNLVTTTQNESVDEEMLHEVINNRLLELDLNGNIVGILHSYNDSQADVVRCDKMLILHGKDFFFEEMMQLFFKISPFSFFQTNSFGAEVLYSTARDYVGTTKDKTIFDLYSGTGTIAQILAPVAKKVIGVEIVEEAVEAAKENASLNDLDNCEFIAGDVLKVLDDIDENPDIIVLDPPREGINPKALKKIVAHSNTEKIIYISCKPTSLANDLVALQEYGYEVKKVTCVDMFPGTQHVETVCLLSKLHEAKHHVSVKLDMEEMDITAAES